MTPIEFHTGFSPTVKQKFHEGKPPEEYHVYDCPFPDCDSSQHIYFFPSTTTWDCKKCGRKGNVRDFYRFIYDLNCNQGVKELKEEWDLPLRVFAQVRYNPLNQSYVIPSYRNAKMNNLYKYVPSIGKVFATPGIPTTLLDWTDDAAETILLCEGQKDRFAGDAIIGSREAEMTAVGVPGAHMFRESWVPALQDKHVIIGFDNDQAGEDGRKKLLDMIKGSSFKPRSVSYIKWREHSKKGYDLHDHYLEYKGRSWAELHELIHEIKEEELVKSKVETVLADEGCDSYDKALDAFSEAYYLTKDMRAALAMVMASIYSTNLEGEQVWLKLIGTPGAGKSTISKAVSASDYVVNMSTFTGLFSGWKDGDDKDPSLVPLIAGRTLIVKDADALMKQSNIEKIMSELRDFYDKDSSVRYGNRQSYSYQDIRSTFIMMGTQVLRRADQSFLGERLLTVEMNLSPSEEENIKNTVMKSKLQQALGQGPPPALKVMASFKGWIDHLKERKPDVQVDEEFQKYIMDFCSLAARMRTAVDRDFKGKLLSPAMPELPTRLIGQFINSTISLCVLMGQNKPNEDVFQIIKKLTLDTINPRSHRFLICDLIIDNPGITALNLVEASGLDKNVVGDELRDLKELKFVNTKDVQGTRAGFRAEGYFLSSKIAPTFQEIT